MEHPIKITAKSEALPIGLTAAALVLSAYFYLRFPEKVATHWNFAGQVDGWSSRGFSAFFAPALMVFMYALFLILPLIDPKKARYAEFAPAFSVFRGMLLGFIFFVHLVTGLYNLGIPVPVGTVVPMAVGVLFVVMGKYLSQIKKNWFMGIRTPWTLSSESVWNRTHRFGGRGFMGFGLLLRRGAWWPEFLALPLLLGGVITVSLGSMAYSYVIYRQEELMKSGR